MYTQLYTITSKYYFKSHFNGPDEARTRVLQAAACVSDTLENLANKGGNCLDKQHCFYNYPGIA